MKRGKILVVDDNQGIRSALKMLPQLVSWISDGPAKAIGIGNCPLNTR